jgi:two-component system NtrC family sensor kinase
VAAWEWGDWRSVAYTVAAWAFTSITNTFVSFYLLPRGNGVLAEHTRAVANTVAWVSLGHAIHWVPPIWMLVPFYSTLATGLRASHGRLRVAAFLGTWTAVALHDGAGLDLTLAFVILGSFCYWVCDARANVIEEMLAERTDQNAQLRQAQDELKAWHSSAIAQEKLASLGMLASGMAHEINNPMSFVTANVRALVEDLRDARELPSALLEYRDDVMPATLDGILRVNAIIADLRRFARGEREKRVAFDAVVEVEAALRMARAQLGPGQAIQSDLAPVPRVNGMPRQIGQVVLNLILNGLQALDGGGSVRVTTRATEGEIEIAVEDTGRGMSEETRGHLFEPFFTTKAHGAGMGLGLAVAHGIVRDHGGRIAVDSEVGRGSTFMIRLPACCIEVSPPGRAAAASASSPAPA